MVELDQRRKGWLDRDPGEEGAKLEPFGPGSKPGNNQVCVWSVGELWPSRPISSSQRVINPMVAERNHDCAD